MEQARRETGETQGKLLLGSCVCHLAVRMSLCGASTNNIKKVKAWGRRDGSAAKCTPSCRGPGLTPRAHMVAHTSRRLTPRGAALFCPL